MPVNLKGRSFLTLMDFTPAEIDYLLNLAADLKAKKKAGVLESERQSFLDGAKERGIAEEDAT